MCINTPILVLDGCGIGTTKFPKVVWDGGTMSYFADANDKEPTFTFNLKGCVLKMLKGENWGIEIYQNLNDKQVSQLSRSNVSLKVIKAMPNPITIKFENETDFWYCWDLIKDEFVR